MGRSYQHRLVSIIRKRFNIKIQVAKAKWFYKLLLTRKISYVFSDHFTVYNASFVKKCPVEFLTKHS